jgi:hypothetical protein
MAVLPPRLRRKVEDPIQLVFEAAGGGLMDRIRVDNSRDAGA